MERDLLDKNKWRILFCKLNIILCIVITGLEFAIFLILKSSNGIVQTLPVYLWNYFYRPTLCNVLFTLGGNMVSKLAKKESIKNAAPVVALSLVFGNVLLTHDVFFVTMMIFAIPIFMCVFFGSEKLLWSVTGIGMAFLGFLPVYSRFDVEAAVWKNKYFIPSLIIAFVTTLSSAKIASNLIKVLKRQNERLLKAAEDARASEEKAVHANQTKSQFLSMASHEIRTPMNAVVGMTDLLLKGENLSDLQRSYLENIKVSGTSLVMIVNDILDQSKIEAGKMEIVEEPYEIRALLANVRMIIENRIGEKPIQLLFDVDEKVTKEMIGDGLRIRQILINLMNNSVKFTEKGFIKVSIKVVEELEDGAMVRFSISDTGQGIKSEDLSRLFKAFSQVDTKKNHHKEGTGLGLSISANFIELMGGRLEVTSEYGNGSEFFFTIMQRMVESSKDVEEAGVERAFTAPEAKILVVDDTSVNLVVAAGLMGTFGIHIDKAESGMRAIEMILQNRYDIVFMDYLMPNMNGVETTAKLRELQEKYKGTDKDELSDYIDGLCIIALTGDTSKEAKDSFIRVGMKDFLEKPLDIDHLKDILKKWLPENLIVDK